MRYVVYGAGAVGGVIGGRLALADRAVTLVARGDHLAAIRDRGLTLDAGDGRHRIAAPATDTAAEVGWTDDTVVLRRPHHDSPVSFVDFDDAAVSQAREVIDALADGALPAVPTHTTGL